MLAARAVCFSWFLGALGVGTSGVHAETPREPDVDLPPAKRFAYPATVALSASTVGLAAIAIGTGLGSQSSYDKLTHCATCEGERSFGHRLQVVSLVTLVIGSATLVGTAIAAPYEHARARREAVR